MATSSGFFATGVLLFALFSTVKSDDTCDIEIENTLRTLLTPQEHPSIQLQALRSDILHKFQEALGNSDEDNYRTLNLLDWYNKPDKRNLEALARAGYIRTLPVPSEEDPGKKRSTAINGQNDYENKNDKRGIEALARNGDLRRRKDIQELLEELYNKRNIGSLARNFDLPSSTYGKRFLGSLAKSGNLPYADKRNIAALARDGGISLGKRNVAALLRMDDYLNSHSNEAKTQSAEEKRNLASIKAHYPIIYKRSVSLRNKRQADYYDRESEEYPSPVYQNQNGYGYEELLRALAGAYPETEKRFLGSVAKSGWFRPSSVRYTRYQAPEKRHIGALARLGWLPSSRSVRRFNRSGRSACLDSCRETSANGQAEDDSISEDPLSLEEKRFLLQPAVDRILLKKILMHPKTHPLITARS